jgi:leucyl-tRNA synthetase
LKDSIPDAYNEPLIQIIWYHAEPDVISPVVTQTSRAARLLRQGIEVWLWRLSTIVAHFTRHDWRNQLGHSRISAETEWLERDLKIYMQYKTNSLQ